MNDEPEIIIKSPDIETDDEVSVSLEDKIKPEQAADAGDAKDVLSRRLHELSTSLQHQPDCSTLYLLRGELFLSRREYHLAKDDFEQAIALAQVALPEMAWGLVEQSVLDRAQQGLKTAYRFVGN